MDHDRLFKELIITFFFEFIELLLPDLAEYLDRDYLEFLDKEIFTDVASGDRHEVDLLVKVRFRGFGEAFFLIHIENQAFPQAHFPRRMFRYFAHLDEKYSLPIFPIAIFSYDQPLRAEPNQYVVEFPNCRVLDFQFRAIQLNRLNWRDYVRHPNPVASALMTKMQIAPEDRPRVKLECLRMLATLKLDKARSTLISVFMDSYLKLTAAETMVYNEELAAVEPEEREAVMQWTNEWIERGRVEGRTEGRTEGLNEGRTEGRRDIVLRLLRRRVGALPPEITDRVGVLVDSQVDELAEALLDFRQLDDAKDWLAQHA